MAIQFNCPYCTATIQVPDNAAGKKGTCPQCHTKVVVPTPKAAPPVASASAMPNPGPVPPAGMMPPVGVMPPAGAMPPIPFPAGAVPPGFAPPWPPPPNMPGVPFAPGPGAIPGMGMPYPAMNPAQAMPPMMPGSIGAPDQEPSLARPRARRKSSNNAVVWGVGIVSLLIVAGVGYWLYDRSTPKFDPMKGELTAARHEDGKLEPVLVHRDWIGLDDETVKTVLDQLSKRAVTLRSEIAVLKLQGSADGIKVSVAPGTRGELISVDISSHKGLSSWYKKEVNKLSDKHQKEVAKAAQQFVQDWAEAEVRGEKKRDFGKYHDDLGVAALAMGVGSETIAVVGQTVHRCVAEQQGKLFFLLPPGVEKFDLQGDPRAKTKSVFPGQFKVKVTGIASSKKSKSSGDSRDDMEAPEDSADEAKTKAFGTPAINDPSAADESMPEKPAMKKTKAK